MATKQQILRALDFLTDGGDAPVAQALKAEAASLQASSMNWIYGDGIQGLGISYKEVESAKLQDLSLKVYVEKKLPEERCDNPVPGFIDSDSFEERIVTDVVEIGKVTQESNTARVRPMIPGYGVGHVNITVGTLGCLVRKNTNSDKLYMLSNSHVLADEGLGSVGDTIIQPGDHDGGSPPGDKAGELADWVPFQFAQTGFPNLVDAAIAEISPGSATSAIDSIGVPGGFSNAVRIGTRVQKSGRTTGYTIGQVTDINYRLGLQYTHPNGGQARVGFRDQVLCTRYTAGGDSGSAVLNMNANVVGLHFAGSPSSSIFNKIRHVLSAMDIQVVSGLI
jgi:hypothetical protein